MLTVHANPNPKSRTGIPYLMDVQADLMRSLGTRVIVPLYLRGATRLPSLDRLAPLVEFQGQVYIAMVPELTAIHQRELGPAVGELTHRRAEILAALDLLFTGF